MPNFIHSAGSKVGRFHFMLDSRGDTAHNSEGHPWTLLSALSHDKWNQSRKVIFCSGLCMVEQ